MYELTVPLNDSGDRPLYEQIYVYIKRQIKQGNLPAKTKLPSTRKLAEHLGVSRSTTQMAYDQLLSEGYLEAEPYRGYYVSELEALFDLGGQTVPGGEREQEKDRKWICDFSLRGIDLESFPYGIWRRLSKNILNGDNKELFSAGENKGDLKLRQAICTYLYGARGVTCRPEQLIVGAGNEYLLMLLNQLFGNQNVIAMETPTYRQAYRVFDRLGHLVVPVEMDENGMDIRKLAVSGADIAYVMPSHQFPTGIVMPIRRRMELLSWAAEKEGRYIIEDDYDSEFRYRGKPIPSLQSADTAGRVIYLGTFSRAVAPAIRVSYMMLPTPLLEQYEGTCSFYASTVSRIDQRILAEFIENGYYERHLNKMRGIYKAKHDALLTALLPLAKEYSISGEHAGIHILLKSVRGVSEERLVSLAEEAGVRVYGLSEFGIGDGNSPQEIQKDRSGTVLLGYANLSREEIEKGADLLCRAFSE
ncbi:PLP-dependent aminotransferase family protein [Lacrimispora sp. NSJ-141]|uniref:PLP-dependent aminotransferase family protein n=1 Tax=Lientehia hominis TaxID=2897778 RepID=A0AAP2W7Q6_9FIRM|nr:PLP-dependent aminotransferase family protein [Lientehia hominis]MCD2491261.1 PLP-dependent aminotransferase family protein [Lientehia hominis]